MPLFNKGNIFNVLRRSMKYLSLRKLNIFRRSSEKFKNSVINLLIDEDIPIKNSPPKPRNVSTMEVHPIQYFSSKRSHPDSEAPENLQPSLKVRKREPISRPKIVRTINFNVDVKGELGLTIERDPDSIKAKYFISKINSNSQAIDRRRLWLGDEVVKISKQQIRGTSENQLKQTIENCLGNVDLTVSRDPNFSFEGNLLDDWTKHLIPRTKDESQIWKLLDSSENVIGEDKVETVSEDFEIAERRCKIVGCLRKNRIQKEFEKMEQVKEEEEEEEEVNIQEKKVNTQEEEIKALEVKKVEDDGNLHQVTGMTKFFQKKTRVDLPQDLIEVQLESASVKKLGFTIVGGSDCKIGNLGIFVKTIFPESQAAEMEKLKVGDEIWTVNEALVKGKTHAEALQIIQEAKSKPMTLKIRRGFTKVKF